MHELSQNSSHWSADSLAQNFNRPASVSQRRFFGARVCFIRRTRPTRREISIASSVMIASSAATWAEWVCFQWQIDPLRLSLCRASRVSGMQPDATVRYRHRQGVRHRLGQKRSVLSTVSHRLSFNTDAELRWVPHAVVACKACTGPCQGRRRWWW